MDELKHLLSPITIKKTEIPNRVVMPPMGTGLCNPDGTVNDALLAYMRRQASSGAGMIISAEGAPSQGPITTTGLGSNSESTNTSKMRVYQDTLFLGHCDPYTRYSSDVSRERTCTGVVKVENPQGR